MKPVHDRIPAAERALWTQVSGETQSFLRNNIRSIMVTRRPDGSPTGHPMSAFFGANGLFFNTYGKSAKARNLRRDPAFCCLVTSFGPRDEKESVLIRGVARFVDNSEPETFGDQDGIRRARLASPLAEESGSPADQDPDEAERRRARAAERVADGKRVVFEMVPKEIGPLTRPHSRGKGN